ncbi:MAG: hypothetical protein H6720_06685 [Sandaracinus sp.]|nr:hypothetical protein [Sandaracinus sp.]
MFRRAWVLCFVCAACGSAGGREDAGDAQDARAPTDARPDAPVDSGPPWEAEVPVLPGELIVHSAEPCAEWRTVEEPRGLPPDPTPRVLWSFRVEEDPLGYGDTGYSGLYGATLSATGDLWSYGPSQRERAAVVIRDGRIVARWERTPAHYSLPLAAAPDGAVFYRASRLIPRCDGECPADVIAPLVRAELREGEIVERSVQIPTNPFRIGGAMALGTRGQVYTMGGVSETERRPQSLFAVCGEDLRIRWERRFRVSPRIISVGDGLWVRPDGSVHVLYVAGGTKLGYLSVSPEGEATPGIGGTEELPQRIALAASTTHAASYDVVPTETGFQQRWNVEGPEPWTTAWFDTEAEPLRYPIDSRIAPDFETVLVPLGGRMESIRRDGTQVVLPEGYVAGTWIATASGTWLVFEFEDGARSGWTHLDANFEELWHLPGTLGPSSLSEQPLPVRGSHGAVLGPNGVLYVVGGDRVMAIQTDVLPPPLSSCVNPGCNHRRDQWVHAE